MRVIAGTARGRRLNVPPGDAVRPTGDRVREALFSSIAARLRDAVVVDLFAGTGALGIEALSRGAAHATFVESDRRTVEVVRANVEVAGVADRADVVSGRAMAFLRTGPGPFTLAFVDPPYSLDEPELEDLLGVLVDHLADDALVVVERDRRSPAPNWPVDLEPEDERAYGTTRLHRAVRVPRVSTIDSD